MTIGSKAGKCAGLKTQDQYQGQGCNLSSIDYLMLPVNMEV